MKTKPKRRQKKLITLKMSFEPDLNADWIKHANPEATRKDRAAGELAAKAIANT